MVILAVQPAMVLLVIPLPMGFGEVGVGLPLIVISSVAGFCVGNIKLLFVDIFMQCHVTNKKYSI